MRLPAACADRSPRRASRRSLLIESNEGARAERDTVSAKRGSSWMSFQNCPATCAHSREVNQSNCDIERNMMHSATCLLMTWFNVITVFLRLLRVWCTDQLSSHYPSFFYYFANHPVRVSRLEKYPREEMLNKWLEAFRCTTRHKSKEANQCPRKTCRLRHYFHKWTEKWAIELPEKSIERLRSSFGASLVEMGGSNSAIIIIRLWVC